MYNLTFNARVCAISHFKNEENGAQGIGVTHPGLTQLESDETDLIAKGSYCRI